MIASVLFLSSVAVVAAITFFGLTHIQNQPYPTTVSNFSLQQPIRIYDANHYTLYEAYAQTPSDFISPSDIPDTFSKSIVALEDSEFYSHHGITLRFIRDLCKEKLLLIPTEKKRSLTQQLAENYLGHKAISLPDQLQELILTFQLEKSYSKAELLAMYVSVQTFGPEIGAEHASNRLFNKSLEQLSDQESILLASVINSEPLREITIQDMIEKNYQETMTSLKMQKVFSDAFLDKNNSVPAYAPQLKIADSNAVRLILNEVKLQLPTEYQVQNGFTIYSTINLSFQNDIQRVVIEQFPHSELTVPQATLLLVDTKTGSVKALTGYTSNSDTLTQLYVTAKQLQVQADPSVSEHLIDRIITPQGSEIKRSALSNSPPTNQVQAQDTIVSAVTANTIIAGWVLDSDTNLRSVDESEKTVDAVVDHLLQSLKESNTK